MSSLKVQKGRCKKESSMNKSGGGIPRINNIAKYCELDLDRNIG